MTRLKKLNSGKKRALGLIFSLLIIVIGLVPHIVLTFMSKSNHSYIIEPIKLESSKGIYISAWKYTPTRDKNHGGIVVGHYLSGNKVHMHPLSSELAKRGFTVISIDFRGHGASAGSPGIGLLGYYREDLEKDIEAAVRYFEQNLTYITEIGLVGHSLGGDMALSLARTYPTRINATVIIGTLPSNILNISNLLMIIAAIEPGITEPILIKSLREYTGKVNVSIGVHYGDWTNGNNTMAYVDSSSGHLFEVMDTDIIYQTVKWFEQAFAIESTTKIFITAPLYQIFSFISLSGIILLTFILIVYLSRSLFKRKMVFPEREILKNFEYFSLNTLVIYYSLYIALIGFLIFLLIIELFKDVLLISTVSINILILFGNTIGTALVYKMYSMTLREKITIKKFFRKLKFMSLANSSRSIIFGFLSAILLITSMSTVWHWSVHNITPTILEIGIMIGLVFISFPLLLIKEFYFRIVQGRLKNKSRAREYLKIVIIGIFMDILIIGLIKLVNWTSLFPLHLGVSYVFVWIIFSTIQNIFTPWIYMWSGRNILGSTTFLSIFTAWMSIIFLPSFGFL
ncbi:MAG: alpha/beta hydrolase [Promethearchaeota archaeon]|jgi:hypothetical protein